MCIKLALLREEGQLSVSFIKVEGNANSHVGSLSCVTVSFGGASSCHCGDVALWKVIQIIVIIFLLFKLN